MVCFEPLCVISLVVVVVAVVVVTGETGDLLLRANRFFVALPPTTLAHS